MSATTNIKRLYKSRTERMVDGVCGGVAKYFSVDPTLVRVAWVLVTLLGGAGILLYIVAMIVIPKEPYVVPFQPVADTPTATSTAGSSTEPSKRNSLFWGILLIAVGTVLFLHNINFDFWRHWWWFDGGFVLSVLLILIGVAFLWGGRNSLTMQTDTVTPAPDATMEPQPVSGGAYQRLFRSFTDSKLFGVCGGIAQYFGIDSSIVRIAFLVGALASGGAVVVAYIILAIVVPKELPSYKPI
jgi:phage shock protein C